MSHEHKYTPVLLWKTGEFQAALDLPDATKAMIIPLIVIPSIGWDFSKHKMEKTLDQHLPPYVKRICNKWGKSPCFVDMDFICKTDKERMNGEVHPVEFLFNELRTVKCSSIPVTGIERGVEFQKEIKKVLDKDKAGICFRIRIEHAARGTFKDEIDSLLKMFDIEANDAHFVLDLGAPNFIPLDGFVKVVLAIVGRLPYLDSWQTFSIAGTSFPATMGGITEEFKVLPRYEWLFYKQLVLEFKKKGLRVPIFGDYAIANPNMVEMDWRLTTPAASIRYTIDENWCIMKGKSIKKHKLEQFFALSKKLVESKYYAGEAFSEGDKFIRQCANKEEGPGNLTTWRKVGTSHHIAKVMQDLANFDASLKSP